MKANFCRSLRRWLRLGLGEATKLSQSLKIYGNLLTSVCDGVEVVVGLFCALRMSSLIRIAHGLISQSLNPNEPLIPQIILLSCKLSPLV